MAKHAAKRHRRDQDAQGRWARPVARRYELRPAGFLYVAVTLFIAIGAVNSQNNLLFWLFGMAVGAVVVSGIVSGSAMMGLRASRSAPATIEAGRSGVVIYQLAHRGRRSPAFALLIRELGHGDESDTGRAEVGMAHVVHLAPGGRARARARARGLRRGGVTLSRFEVSTTFPFGLFRKAVVFDTPAQLIVTPPRIELSERVIESAAGGGEHGTPRGLRSGLSDEFFGLRAYVPGDSPRLISWKRSAALGELVVRQSAAPTPPRLTIRLSQSLRDADESDQEIGVALAGSLAATACARGFMVCVEAEWAGVLTALGGGGRHAGRCLRELAMADLSGTRPVRARPGRRRAASSRLVVSASGAGQDDSGDSMHVSTREAQSWLARGASLPDVLAAPTPESGQRRGPWSWNRRSRSGSLVRQAA